MTGSKDPFEDAALEAFLEGKGELAQQLGALAHAEPSPELDAAILARIEADLAAEGPRRAAVNDPIGPGVMTRWGVPLAAAACGVVAILIVLRQAPPEQDPALIAAAPQALSVESLQRSPPESAALEDKAESMGRVRAVIPEKIAKSKAAEIPARPAKVDMDAAPEETKSSSPVVEQQLAELSPRGAQTNDFYQGAPATELVERRDLAPSSPLKETENSDASRNSDTTLAQAAPAPTVTATFSMYSARKRLDSPAAAPSIDAAAPIADATPVGAAAVTPPTAMDSLRANAPQAMAAAPVPATPAVEDPKLWLARIEELLKSDSPERALPEWEKFRKAYPDYVVTEKIEVQIKLLKK